MRIHDRGAGAKTADSVSSLILMRYLFGSWTNVEKVQVRGADEQVRAGILHVGVRVPLGSTLRWRASILSLQAAMHAQGITLFNILLQGCGVLSTPVHGRMHSGVQFHPTCSCGATTRSVISSGKLPRAC
jgi:hypothetical protein